MWILMSLQGCTPQSSAAHTIREKENDLFRLCFSRASPVESMPGRGKGVLVRGGGIRGFFGGHPPDDRAWPTFRDPRLRGGPGAKSWQVGQKQTFNTFRGNLRGACAKGLFSSSVSGSSCEKTGRQGWPSIVRKTAAFFFRRLGNSGTGGQAGGRRRKTVLRGGTDQNRRPCGIWSGARNGGEWDREKKGRTLLACPGFVW